MVQISQDGRVSGKLATFIEAFFKDTERGEDVQPSSPGKLSQKFVNELIGSQLDRAADASFLIESPLPTRIGISIGYFQTTFTGDTQRPWTCMVGYRAASI